MSEVTAYDNVMMFKTMLLQKYYNLGDKAYKSKGIDKDLKQRFNSNRW